MDAQIVEQGDFATHPAIKTKVLVQSVTGKWATIIWIDSRGETQLAKCHYAALTLLEKDTSMSAPLAALRKLNE